MKAYLYLTDKSVTTIAGDLAVSLHAQFTQNGFVPAVSWVGGKNAVVNMAHVVRIDFELEESE